MAEALSLDAPLIVLGMHRSGTSLVSNWLHDSGLFLGTELYGASAFNRGGYFEDVEFIRLHESFLCALGQHPSGHELPMKRQHAPTPDMIARLAAFVDARRQKTAWGWKDPRSCLLLDMYRDACPDARYLIVLRHHASIVHSMVRRERTTQSRWARLARGKTLSGALERHYERKFTNRYLKVTSQYFSALQTHLSICSDNCVALDLDSFGTAADALAHALAKLGIALNPVPVTNILRPDELSANRDLRFATPDLLTRVLAQYKDLKGRAV